MASTVLRNFTFEREVTKIKKKNRRGLSKNVGIKIVDGSRKKIG